MCVGRCWFGGVQFNVEGRQLHCGFVSRGVLRGGALGGIMYGASVPCLALPSKVLQFSFDQGACMLQRSRFCSCPEMRGFPGKRMEFVCLLRV